MRKHVGPCAFSKEGSTACCSCIDEIRSTGAFIHPSHPRFSDSPAFGSFGEGGFINPEESARECGAYFAERKKEFFRNEILADTEPGRREKKGSDLLFAHLAGEMPHTLRQFGPPPMSLNSDCIFVLSTTSTTLRSCIPLVRFLIQFPVEHSTKKICAG